MVPAPKIICIGRNFHDHAWELNNPIPENPVVFLKPYTSLCSPELPIQYPEFTANLQYECEIVLQINKTGKNIPEQNAAGYVTQWTLGLDLTARDLQQELKSLGLPWELSKAFDQSAAVGKFLPVDLKNEKSSVFTLHLNGKEVQVGTTQQMIFSFSRIIHFVSRFFTLQPGDLIFTGTPKGVGMLQPGDQLLGHLNGVAVLKQSIIAY